MAADWSDIEIELIVSDYFEMLRLDVAGETYNKAEHNRSLQERIDRTKGSIEFKHQNISAVLLGLGQPWITGYKPASNFQARLVDKVLEWLDGHSDWLSKRQIEVARLGVADPSDLWIGPPPTQRNEPPPVDHEAMRRLALKYDVVERDARNKDLGDRGEAFVLEYEQRRLQAGDQPELAEKVRWTAREDGDGYGYDISSFELDGRPRLIEVKTTNGWDRTPFHITRNELRIAEERRDHWCLLRLYDFARKPKAFELRPPLESHVELIPSSYLAKPH